MHDIKFSFCFVKFVKYMNLTNIACLIIYVSIYYISRGGHSNGKIRTVFQNQTENSMKPKNVVRSNLKKY